MKKKWIFIAPLAIAGIIVAIVIGGELVKYLWNWLAPPIFGLRRITFWQACGLLALCRILFGRVGGRGFSRFNMRGRLAGRMTEDERERFRQRMRERCGFGPSTSAGAEP